MVEIEYLTIERGVKQGCIMSPCLFNLYMDAVMKEVKGRMGVRLMEEEREWRLPGLLCPDELVLCDESEKDLKVVVRRFVKVCRKRGLKVNADKSKVMVLSGEEGLKCEISVDGARLEQMTYFKYL